MSIEEFVVTEENGDNSLVLNRCGYGRASNFGYNYFTNLFTENDYIDGFGKGKAEGTFERYMT